MEQMGEARQNRPCHDSDALVGVGVRHNAIMFDSLRTMEDTVDTYDKKVAATKI